MATVHIIGAGISGLSAATMIAEKRIPVKIYEATAHAGGRCRSSRDSVLGLIDHGLHTTSPSDHELKRYLARIAPTTAAVPVAALAFPAAPVRDYLPLLHWLVRPRGRAEQSMACDSMLHDAWFRPMARVLFATPPDALPAGSIRQLPSRYRRQMMRPSLQAAYIQPALDFLDQYGGSIYFGHALTRIERRSDGTPKALVFARKKIELAEDDLVILAAPPAFVQSLLPELVLPAQTQSAITLHFQCTHREAPDSVAYPLAAPMDLLRYRDGQISAMIRLAGYTWNSDPELLAHRVWRSIQQRHGYLRGTPMPDCAIWREKRAGHVVSEAPAIPADHGALLLAGDWLAPSRPPTLEAAAASGHAAAAIAIARIPSHAVPEQLRPSWFERSRK